MIELGVSAILFNCCQPEVIEQALTITRETLQKHGALHIQTGAYANAFAPQGKEATANEGLDEVRQDLDPQAYLAWAKNGNKLEQRLLAGAVGLV